MVKVMKIIRQDKSFIVGGGISPRLDREGNPVRVIYIHLGFWTLYTNEKIDWKRLGRGKG